MADLIALGAGLLTILVAAELFTNGVEWLGRKLNLAEGAVGGVLAAVGTALPETMIPLVAITLTGSSAGGAGDEIGVGAILGAPFMLATLAMFATGVGVVFWRRRRATGLGVAVDTRAVFADMRFFWLAYAIAIGAAFLPNELEVLRWVAVAATLAIYVAFVHRQLSADSSTEAEELAPLRLRRLDRRFHERSPDAPRLWLVTTQVAAAVALIVGGAIVFVDGVQGISRGLGIDPALLALLIAPVATELPETFNSLIWVRQNKDGLALGNITGAMVFQACIPTAIGIALAAQAWTVTPDNLLTFASAAIAFAASAAIVLPMAARGSLSGRHLLIGGVFYAIYAGVVLSHLAGLW